MNDIAGIPYSTAEFDKDGKLLHSPNVPEETTDVIVVSHGWNNTREEAEDLYRKLFTNFAEVTKGDPEIEKLEIALVGVIWPARKFSEFMSEPPSKATPAGGAAAAGGGADPETAQAAMLAAIERVSPLFESEAEKAQLAKLRSLVPKLEDSHAAQQDFVLTLRELHGGAELNSELLHPEDASDVSFEGDPQIIFDNVKLAAPASANELPIKISAEEEKTDDKPSDALGGAAGVFDVFSHAANAVTSLLNHTTYFEMKKRAGTVGQFGVAPLIDKLAAGPKLKRIHLVGHSFGGRVVSATAANSATQKLHSMCLLQAAFSHYGFSKSQGGFFRAVIDKKRLPGATLITHTKNDRAVGLAYPAASRINGDKAMAFGDANDAFGGMGSNGPQKMEKDEVSQSAATLLEVRSPYSLRAGKLHSLNSDAFIVDPKGGDAHGWVFVPQVAWAISRAILS